LNAQSQPVNHEAVRMLAIEIGAREAARKLGLNEDTVCTWSAREKWKLPRRNVAGLSPVLQASLKATPAEALLSSHKDLEERGKSAIARASVKSAEAHGSADVPNAKALAQLANALGRVFQWSTGGGNTVNVHADKAVIVCDEGRRAELIEQRQRLLSGDPASHKATQDAKPAKATEA
jgi:hypothetical protein